MDEHAGALVLYARQLCGDPEDAVQQAFMKLVAERNTPQSVVAWLYKVVRNEALSASRTARRRKSREQAVGETRSGWFESTEQQLCDSQTAAEALASLPREQREIVTAHLWGGLTFREISEMLGLPSSVAHRRYHEALEELRKRIGVPCPNQK